MHIKNIQIDSFGVIRGLSLELAPGLNIIEGENESGKSSVAMFIKFIFYGLSGRSSDGVISERRRYVNWETGMASGFLTLEKDNIIYKIERELYVSSSDTDGTTAEAVRERVTVTNEATGEKLMRGQVPGVVFFSMTEQMFYNSVFVRQLTDASIDGTGMAEAIENILYSGDEGISTRRATERLDKSRKVLLHKNGSGGRIYELRREKQQLEQQLEGAREKNLEILELESAIADSKNLIEARERQAAYLSQVSDAFSKISASDKLAELEKYEKEEKRLSIILDSYPARVEIEQQCEELRQAVHKRGEAELRLKAIRMKISSLDSHLPPLLSESEREDNKRDIAETKTLNAKKKSTFTFSLALFILGAICAAGAIFLRSADSFIALAALASGVVMIVVAAILLGISMSALKKLNAVLDKWNAPSPADIENIINEHIEKNQLFRDDSSEIGTLMKEEIKATEEREEIVSQQRILAARFTADEPDTDIMTEKALSAAAAQIEEINKITREYDTIRGRLSMFEGLLTDEREKIKLETEAVLETEEGKKALAMGQQEREKLERDKGFYFSTAEAQRKRHNELEKKLSALLAVSVSPSEIAGKIDIINRELQVAEDRLAGIVGAIEALDEAGNRLRSSLLPRIVSEAGVLLGAFTGGKYTGLGVGRDFSMTFSPGGYTREADYMSAGTRDAAYISLRYALMKVLFPEGSPTAVYDESFARIDEDRLSKLLSILASAGDEGMQSLVFTCRTLESTISGADIPLIKL